MKKQAAGSEKAFFSKSGTSCNIQANSLLSFSFSSAKSRMACRASSKVVTTGNTIMRIYRIPTQIQVQSRLFRVSFVIAMRFDPGQERCKFSTGQFNPPFRRFGKVKGTAFQALHPNRKAISLPLQNLHHFATATEKYESVTRFRLLLNIFFHRSCKAVKRFAHADRRGAVVELYCSAETEHANVLKTVKTFSKVA